MAKISKLGIIIAVILIVGISLFFIQRMYKAKTENSVLDDFAKCLTDNGVKMYGAFWCPHCNNQKEMFGNSWKFVNYIECSLPNRAQNELCRNAGINAYPTWEFSDGNRIEGELTFESLSKNSNCKLPEQE